MDKKRDIYGYKEIYYEDKEEGGEPRKEAYRITCIGGIKAELKEGIYRNIGSDKKRFKEVIGRLEEGEIRDEDIEVVKRLIIEVERGMKRYKKGRYYRNILKEC